MFGYFSGMFLYIAGIFVCDASGLTPPPKGFGDLPAFFKLLPRMFVVLPLPFGIPVVHSASTSSRYTVTRMGVLPYSTVTIMPGQPHSHRVL
jgi:hypothetical protein